MKVNLKKTVARLEDLDNKFRQRADNLQYPQWLMMPTNEGSRFLIATALLGLASFNTGNNMIYLIFGLMLSIIALSYVLVTINLKGLTLFVRSSGSVYANTSATLELRLHNRKSIASYSLRIRLPDEKFSGQGCVAYIEGGKSINVKIPITVKGRGNYGYGSFYVQSGFPFIFFHRKVRVRVDGSLLVYPELIEISIDRLSGRQGQGRARMSKGQGDELYSIRQFAYGDDLKAIHWKASAKADNLLVREFATQETRVATLVLDNYGQRNADDFERSVSYAASVAHKLIREGYSLGLLTCGSLVTPRSGYEQLYKIMDELAVIQLSQTCRMPPDTDDKALGALVLILGNNHAPFINSPFAALAGEAAMRVYNADIL